MDGHGYYPNNYNAHPHSQSASNNEISGCADNVTPQYVQANHAQFAQANHQPMSASGAGFYTHGFNENVHQHPSSGNSFYGYAESSMGHYAQSQQSRSRTDGEQMYQQSASGNSGFGHVENNPSSYAQCNYQSYQSVSEGSYGYGQPDQQIRVGYNSSDFNQHQQHQSALSNASYGYDLPQSAAAASHTSYLGQMSQPIQPSMNSSCNTQQGLGPSGYTTFQGQYHGSNFSSAPGYTKNINANSAPPFAPSTMLHSTAWQPAPVGMHAGNGMLRNSSNVGGNQVLGDPNLALNGYRNTSTRIADNNSIFSNSNGGFTQPNVPGTNKSRFNNVNMRCNQTNLPGDNSNAGLCPSSFLGQSSLISANSQGVTYSAKNKALPHCQSSALSIPAPILATPGGHSPLLSSSGVNKGGLQYNVLHSGNHVVNSALSASVPSTGASKVGSASISVATTQSRKGVIVNQSAPVPSSGKGKTQATGLVSGKNSVITHTPSTTTDNVKNNTSTTTISTQASKSQTTTSLKSSTIKPANSSTISIPAKLSVSHPGGTTKPGKCLTSSKVVTPKRIEIPSEFPPRHSFRAAAAYSLLRTLSKELRLSPFTLQSFLSALMLPIPSRLLGEVHVRVLRVLFAHAGMGTYAKHGRGDTNIFIKNKRANRMSVKEHDSEGESVEVEEVIKLRGCDNLFFLDTFTWPLFYEDYAVATEEKFLEDMEDEDAFIDIRSTAMIPSELAVQQHFDSSAVVKPSRRVTVPPYPGEGWIDRCPVGAFGSRNHIGRFTCCPFHIHTAVKNYAQQRNLSSLKPSSPKKRTRPATAVKRKRSPNDSSSEYNSSDGSDAESDDDFQVKKKPSKVTGRTGRPRKHPKSEPRTVTSPIKGSLVIDIEIAPATARKRPSTDGLQMAVGVKPQPGTNTSIISPLDPVSHAASNPPQCSGWSYPMTPAKLPPAFVPPIPPYPEDSNAFAVSVSAKDTLARYFKEGDLFCNDVDENAKADDDIPQEKNTIEDTSASPMSKDINAELAHMSPIRQMRKGIPYHHLPLESKLTMIEFLLDEVLTVDEISRELTLRHTLTGQSNILYGMVPHPSEFENMVNEDECTICGLEGDLLCCDGCPGSFHRQCLSMHSGRLPEGKWFCTECRAVDASKMGPNLTRIAECRPLIGWFTLNELDLPPQHIISPHLQGHPTINGGAALTAAPPTDIPQSSSVKIPTDVEFLVTSGKVFARHRSSFRKFDPFKPFPIEYTSPDLAKSCHPEVLSSFKACDPPVPLSNIQVVELLKLLGPAMSLRLPWRQLLFNPEKVFHPSKLALTHASAANVSNVFQVLVSHQKEKRALLAHHSDMANPLEYDNKYRKAPPIPKLKHQLGQFIFPTAMPEMVTLPARAGAQLGSALYATAALDSNSLSKLCFSFHDVIQSLRDALIKIERLLSDGCLLGYQWESLRWRVKVNNTHSFSRLSALLVQLSDACCLRAFQSQWYEVKDNGNHDDITRIASVQKGCISSTSEGWNADRELRTRRWERITKENVLRLFGAEKESPFIFQHSGDATKWGKKKSVTDTKIVDVSVVDKNGSSQEIRAGASKLKQLKSSVTATPSFPTDSCNFDKKNHEVDVDTVTPGIAPSLETFERKDARSGSGFIKAVVTSDQKMDNETPKESVAVKLKSKKRRRTREPSLSPIVKTVRQQIASLLSLNACVPTENTEKKIIELKLDMLEKLLCEENSSFFFSIAGRQLFEPEGTLSPQNVKRLARNAGSVRAPFIAYETSFEVGECSTCHQWRKSTLKGATFEDFMLSLRFFDSHIDKGVTASSCSITNRIAKSKMTPSTSVIRCEQIDQISGIKEYFVVDTKKNQGAWQSEIELDIVTLISHRYSRSVSHRERLKQTQKIKEEQQKHQEDEKKKKIEEEKRQQELSQRIAQSSKYKTKVAPSVSRPAKKASEVTSVSTTSSVKINNALAMHTDLTLSLLKQSAARGEASVPVSAMGTTRELTMKRMESANLLAGATLTADDMKRKMTIAETAAVQKYVKEMNSHHK